MISTVYSSSMSLVCRNWWRQRSHENTAPERIQPAAVSSLLPVFLLLPNVGFPLLFLHVYIQMSSIRCRLLAWVPNLVLLRVPAQLYW